VPARDLNRPNLYAEGYVALHAHHSVVLKAAMSATKPLAHVVRLNGGKSD
jgi:hypothetical protein